MGLSVLAQTPMDGRQLRVDGSRAGVEMPILRFPDGLSAEELIGMLRDAVASLDERCDGKGPRP